MDTGIQQKNTVLGLWDGHDAGAALVMDGQLVAALSEERLTRVKRQGGFPEGAITEVLRLGGIAPEDVDVVAIAGTQGRLPARLLNEQFTQLDPGKVDPLSASSKAFSAYQNHVASIPGLKQAEAVGSKVILRKRLKKLGLGHCSLQLVDHHHAHAASAAATLNTSKEDALVITMDGYGDGCSLTVWILREGLLEKVLRNGPRSSIALLYGALTRDLGFKEGEEGKLTGLAASADPEIVKTLNFRRFLHHFQGRIQVRHRAALRVLRKARESGMSAPNLAGALQWAMEDVVLEFIQAKLKKYECRRLAVAGGLFANVSLNGRIAGIGLDEFAIFPAMTDQGLCAGAAFVAAGLEHPQAVPSMRLGTLMPSGGPDPHEVAKLLASGRFVGVTRGAMEFGPRALGCRTILFDPRRPDLAEELQNMLGRSPFMPFAPILNANRWDEVFTCKRDGLERATREMTLALPTHKGFQELAPVAVHVDGSARPQVIEPLEDPWMYEVLEQFHAQTGCAALINTSFNLHREPIVCSVDDAHQSAKAIELDVLVVGDELIHLSEAVLETHDALI